MTNTAHTPTPTLQDALCIHCQTRIGWHDQYVGCPGFEVADQAELRRMLNRWWLENEPPSGFRNDDDVPRYVLIARAALAKVGQS